MINHDWLSNRGKFLRVATHDFNDVFYKISPNAFAFRLVLGQASLALAL